MNKVSCIFVQFWGVRHELFNSRSYRRERPEAAALLIPSACRFPSPVADNIEAHISLDEVLNIRAPHVYLVSITGESMQGAGIFEGDLATVDRSLEPASGEIISGSYFQRHHNKKSSFEAALVVGQTVKSQVAGALLCPVISNEVSRPSATWTKVRWPSWTS